MAGSVTDSRVRNGDLKLESCTVPGHMGSYQCVPSAVAITPGENTTTTDDLIEVLCGAKAGSSDSETDRTATLDLTLVSDFLEAGLVAYSYSCAGERKFEWTPNRDKMDATLPGGTSAGTAPIVFRGTVKVSPIQIGGEVGQRLQPTVSWEITSLFLPNLYGGVQWFGPKITGITAPSGGNLEWVFDPPNALPFADLATLKADGYVGDGGSDKPNRDFTAGEFAQIRNGVHVHYAATGGWASGDA